VAVGAERERVGNRTAIAVTGASHGNAFAQRIGRGVDDLYLVEVGIDDEQKALVLCQDHLRGLTPAMVPTRPEVEIEIVAFV
jgi:hypothetical protein